MGVVATFCPYLDLHYSFISKEQHCILFKGLHICSNAAQSGTFQEYYHQCLIPIRSKTLSHALFYVVISILWIMDQILELPQKDSNIQNRSQDKHLAIIDWENQSFVRNGYFHNCIIELSQG